MSVDIAEGDWTPERSLVGHEGYGLVALTVADLRAAGQQLIRDPIPDNPHHGVVQGEKTLARRRQMAKAARWVIRPPEAFPPDG